MNRITHSKQNMAHGWEITSVIRLQKKTAFHPACPFLLSPTGFDGRWLSCYELPYGKALRLPWWLRGKETVCNAGDAGLIPGLGKSPGEGHDNPLQYSYLKNPMDRGAWWAMVNGGHKESDTT